MDREVLTAKQMVRGALAEDMAKATDARIVRDIAKEAAENAVLLNAVRAERDRWQQRALRAEGKLAELGRALDAYRDGVQPMPTYAELIRLLQG
jgi:hypothetical protein